MEKLSIIVPVMNGEMYINDCLKSLINQTYKNIEIIVIDDGSTDGTKKIVQEYQKNDKRIILISRENRGYGYTLNEGIRASTGEWIGICESDDAMDLSFAEKMISFVEKDIDIIKCGWYDTIDKQPVRKRDFFYEGSYEMSDLTLLEKLKVFGFQASVWSAIYRKDFLINNNIFFLETPGASFQDTAFTFKLWLNCKKFKSINENLYYYTNDNENSSVKDNTKIYCVCDEYEEMKKVCPEEYRQLLTRLMFGIYYWNYNRLGEEGKQKFFKRMKNDFLESFNYVSLIFFSEEERRLYLSISEEWEDMVVIGIPVYHSRETLPRALDSLVLQTKKMFMVMIVNDADGEDYSDIIDTYKKRGLKITYVVQDENGGPGKCRQRVIDSCKMCEYVMFLDSDDMYSPIAVEVLTRAISQGGLDVVMGNVTQLITGTPAHRANVNATSITWVWNKIYRRRYLIDNDIRFPDDLRVSEDIAFSLPAWNCTEKKTRLDQDIYYWCDNKNSLTRAEGKTEFDKKNINDFVKAQVYGLEKIAEIGTQIDQDLFTPTLKIIYVQVQTANSLGMTEDGYIDVLKRLNNFEQIEEFRNSLESWSFIIKNCPIGIVTENNDVIFFKERFIDWFNRVFSD